MSEVNYTSIQVKYCIIRIYICIFIFFFLNRFYKAEGKLIPEIYSVAEFMGSQLGDCSGDKDNTFMTLRVGIAPNSSK